MSDDPKLADGAAPQETPKDVMESLHAVFTRNGIASYTDYPHLAGDIVHWACEMYRQSKMPPRPVSERNKKC